MDRELFDLFELHRNKLKNIKIYLSYTRIADPYEKNIEETVLNPINIKAIVTQISFEGLRWKYFGELPINSVQVICEKKHLNTLKIAKKIEIEDQQYGVYTDNDKRFQILERENYIVVVLEKK